MLHLPITKSRLSCLLRHTVTRIKSHLHTYAAHNSEPQAHKPARPTGNPSPLPFTCKPSKLPSPPTSPIPAPQTETNRCSKTRLVVHFTFPRNVEKDKKKPRRAIRSGASARFVSTPAAHTPFALPSRPAVPGNPRYPASERGSLSGQSDALLLPAGRRGNAESGTPLPTGT